ncbi:hypothetical protein PYW07_016754 [Mythimna separata]|uniref:Uncharacterized protein n=1 Tax=Mythimna separata TaxID=271217 RepID=A0AAD7YLU6_MYTSE|nr:hypothetical protein PYW07_016754 [Mythimna separata]
MLCRLCLIATTIAVLHQYDSVHGDDMPQYIKKALREKGHVPARTPRHKTNTLSNLTIEEVFDRIKEITRSLNLNAMRNGYKVDYKFRMLNQK